MKAIEIKSKTDKAGHLKIDYQLDKSDSEVRVLILIEDDTEAAEEMDWMGAIKKNPSFDFLEDDAENIYSPKDGEPLDD